MLSLARASNTLARFTNSADYIAGSWRAGALVTWLLMPRRPKEPWSPTVSTLAVASQFRSYVPGSVPQSRPNFINCLLVYYGEMCICCIQFIRCCTAYNILHIQIQIIPQIHTIHYFYFFLFLLFALIFFSGKCFAYTPHAIRHAIPSHLHAHPKCILYVQYAGHIWVYTERGTVCLTVHFYTYVLTFWRVRENVKCGLGGPFGMEMVEQLT